MEDNSLEAVCVRVFVCTYCTVSVVFLLPLCVCVCVFHFLVTSLSASTFSASLFSFVTDRMVSDTGFLWLIDNVDGVFFSVSPTLFTLVSKS